MPKKKAGRQQEEVAAEQENGGDEEVEYEEESPAVSSSGGRKRGDEAKAEASPPASGKNKPLSKSELKRQKKAQGASDLDLLNAGEFAARRERMLQRFLNFIMVGLVLDWWRQRNASPPTSGKKARKTQDTALERLGQVKVSSFFGGPGLMVIFTSLVLFAQFMGEGFSPEDTGLDASPYAILGVDSSADQLTIKRAYKKLAVELHPDKNPDCAECAERFDKIAKAYDIIGEPEKRKAYDSGRSSRKRSKSENSQAITAQNIGPLVLRSNEVWLVHVFDPREDSSSFHNAWEECATKMGYSVRFGQIDASTNKAAMRSLPLRVGIFPAVFRFARNMEPELMPPLLENPDDVGVRALERFAQENFPAVTRFQDASEVSAWASRKNPSRPRLLLVGNLSPNKKPGMQVRRLAHVWNGFVDLATADRRAAKSAFGNELSDDVDGHAGMLVSLDEGSERKVVPVSDVDDTAEAIEGVIDGLLLKRAPFISYRNHEQLCGAGRPVSSSKIYCLVLVDASDSGARDALKELEDSHMAYSKELAELQEGGDAVGEEERFGVQLVRLSTSTSRLPGGPLSPDPSAFRTVWAEVKYAKRFVLELENRMVGEVKAKTLEHIHQDLAYADLKLTKISETVPLVQGIAGDESDSFSSEVRRLASTFIGFLTAFLLVAVLSSVLPELELVSASGVGTFVVAVAIMVNPMACRLLLKQWFPPAFEA